MSGCKLSTVLQKHVFWDENVPNVKCLDYWFWFEFQVQFFSFTIYVTLCRFWNLSWFKFLSNRIYFIMCVTFSLLFLLVIVSGTILFHTPADCLLNFTCIFTFSLINLKPMMIYLVYIVLILYQMWNLKTVQIISVYSWSRIPNLKSYILTISKPRN